MSAKRAATEHLFALGEEEVTDEAGQVLSARETILKRLELAETLAGVDKTEDPKHTYDALPRDYTKAPMLPPNPAVLVKEMRRSLEDYGAEVFDCYVEKDLPAKIVEVLGDLPSAVVSGDAPVDWIRALMRGGRLVYLDSPAEPLGNATLDQVSATITSSRLGIAPTGTIVLDGGPGQGRRAITLLPDTHIVVLYTDTICATVPQAFRVLEKNPTRPMTWISGPSATSDIELSRVDGVHGPRNLKVILARRSKQ